MQIKGFFFDLDGTLVDSKLDFDLMREDLAFPEGVPILEHIDTLTDPNHIKRSHEIVHQHELKGAIESELIFGVIEFLNSIKEKNYPTAILTRNSRECSELMIKKHSLVVDHVITREDFPPKPKPDALLHLAKINNLEPCECIYIGDFAFDIEAARNAGMKAGLILTKDNESFKERADIYFKDYLELKNQLSL
ncbi:HAD family hydrolase [Halobacteriovorax sp. GB3]|uniref:HAD family hydrolase n=1 Tax=Halobacteriovorax sp. GB3 TaxID=2719615 RepID=UPI0023628CA1|nr:HAD family hydrolase [Halobacteriovorax sp. GB3]MDD0851719.1 HAD family hydrolase [Halobacteriovorax sp. GB3]